MLVFNTQRLEFRDLEQQLARELHSAREGLRLAKREFEDGEAKTASSVGEFYLEELRTKHRAAQTAHALALRQFVDFACRGEGSSGFSRSQQAH